MAESTSDVYANAAGLLRNLGHFAEVEEAFTPPPTFHHRGAVVALVTDAPPVIVGHAISQVAEEPEAHLPEFSARAGRARCGEPPSAYWVKVR